MVDIKFSKFLMFHSTNYLLNEQENIFIQLEFDLAGKKNSFIKKHYSAGIDSLEEIEEKRFLFGYNELKINIKSTLDILLDEILNPFNLFQVLFLNLSYYFFFIYFY
jgi:hypothetical protein